MLETTNEILEIIGKFIGIVTGIISIAEILYRIGKSRRGKPVQALNWQPTTELALKWVFLVITTLGLPTIVLALFGVYLADSHRDNINDAFVYSIGYVTGLVMLYSVFWGSVIRNWLGRPAEKASVVSKMR